MVDWFDPAFKAGGPVTSAINFVKALQPYYKIRVLTGSRDLDNTPVVSPDKQSRWLVYYQDAEVYYATGSEMNARGIFSMVKKVSPDFIYCNSMFSYPFTILPLLFKRAGLVKSSIIVAPRGMLKPSAIAFKAAKKKVFLRLLNTLRIPSMLQFQATDSNEVDDIKSMFGKDTAVQLVSNLPTPVQVAPAAIRKSPGNLRILFLGRVHPIKQLDYLLKCLDNIPGDIEVSVAGMLEDKSYYEKCQVLADALPRNVRVHFLGEKQPAFISTLIQEHHILALPTSGENFGHSIFECLGNARPVVISDKTPWRQLDEKQAGFDIDLNNMGRFREAIDLFVQMDQDQYHTWSAGAHQLAMDFEKHNEAITNYLKLFPDGESGSIQLPE